MRKLPKGLLVKMVRIRLENEVGYEDNGGWNGEDGGAIQHDDAGGTEKETGRKPILVCPIQ